jgi:hypothetical protein
MSVPPAAMNMMAEPISCSSASNSAKDNINQVRNALIKAMNNANKKGQGVFRHSVQSFTALLPQQLT